MKDRFDLENDIYDIANTANDIRTLDKAMYDSTLIYDDDRRATALQGLAELVDARADKLIDTYAQLFKLDQYCEDEEALELRNKLFGNNKAWEDYWQQMDQLGEL